MGEHTTGNAESAPPRRRYDIEWDEPGAGFIVDLFDGGKPVINFSLKTDWDDAWHPDVNPAGLQALHAIIDTADPARVARAEALVDGLRWVIEQALDQLTSGKHYDAEATLEAAHSGSSTTEGSA